VDQQGLQQRIGVDPTDAAAMGIRVHVGQASGQRRA
jgi:hypothetical protein